MFKPLVDYFLQIYYITTRVSKQPGDSVTLYEKRKTPQNKKALPVEAC